MYLTKKLKIFIIIVIVLVLGLALWKAWLRHEELKLKQEMCAKLGGVIQNPNQENENCFIDSTKNQTGSNNGDVLPVPINNPHTDLIQIQIPVPNQKAESSIEIKGIARGQWLFEATAPVEIVLASEENITGQFGEKISGENVEVIGNGYITTDEEWMTTDFVSVYGIVEYEIPEDKKSDFENGKLSIFVVFKNANPSGEIENEKSFYIKLSK